MIKSLRTMMNRLAQALQLTEESAIDGAGQSRKSHPVILIHRRYQALSISLLQ